MANETLERYKEINLLYEISGKISTCLDVQAIANLVLDEARRLIAATSGSLMLFNEESQSLQIIAAFGIDSPSKMLMKLGEGIAGNVLLSENAEVVNGVQYDSRFLPGPHPVHSLICAPMKTKSRVLGTINISHADPIQYSAADLKLVTALASQAASAIENALLHEYKLKEERIKSKLERYLAPQIVKAIIESQSEIALETGKRNIAVLFSDIRNFTTKCEELVPEEIVAYLNEYFSQMVDVIFTHEGTVNKFVGDMIVSMFGAPNKLVDSERKAIETAIAMQQRLRNFPGDWIRENFITGIGISSGEVIVGNIGSPQHMDYTAIGDQVNVASRLQSIAQGGQILVSRSIYDLTQELFDFKEVGFVKVKGKKTKVEIFEVIY
uniref:Adenylate/guanylate cyclase domain-containing protein n=1 Tax=Desertifilum tharense IPPAS B-1220 TaxID=1781255 RepID=A0ACD5GSN0_9CYAN